jgi:hypothetical protein
MKKVIFTLLFAFFASMLFAQDIKSVKSDIDKKQLDKAKTDIDAFVAKSPDDAEGQYYKAKVYEQIASSDQFKSLAPDAREQAFEAFKKAMADSSNVKVKLTVVKDQYSPVFNLYTGYYEAAAGAFNAAAPTGNKAGFEDAMNLFIKADNVGQYILENKWSSTIGKVDTTLVLNIAKAALNAGKNDVALTYFKELADAGINGTKDGGEGNAVFILPYQWLMLHYKDVKDEENMMKYANLGKKLFPDSDYFDLVLIDYYREKKDNDALFAKYNDLVTKNPDSLTYHFNFANDIFGYLYNGDEGVVVKSKDSLLQVLAGQLEKAHSIDANDVVTNWLYAQYYYNQGVDTRDAALKIKGPKPEDVKKKADLNTASKDNFNKAIPYAEKAIGTLEGQGFRKSDKSRYKSIVNLMQKIYQSLNQDDKVKLYQDKYDAADTKFTS